MSKIRSKDTKPEKLMRSELFRMGYRYRVHDSKLPGKPDLVFPKYKVAVFVHGCFWHLHQHCREGRLPKSKLDYWGPKLLRNVERDKQHEQNLISMGWTVMIFWECEIESSLKPIAKKIARQLKRNGYSKLQV